MSPNRTSAKEAGMGFLKFAVVVLISLMLAIPAYAGPKGKGAGKAKGQGNAVSAKKTKAVTTEGAMPPGLRKKDRMPKGLEKKDKTPAGWNKGEKEGWKKAGQEKKD